MALTKTPVANLKRDDATGIYFIDAKILGRQIRRTLKTTAFHIARPKMRKVHAEEYEKIKRAREVVAMGGNGVADMIAAYLKADIDDPGVKPRTREYHRDCVKAIRKMWPDLEAMEADKVSEAACLNWAVSLRKKYSPTRFNGTVDALRAIFKIAVDRGLRIDNPTKNITKAPVKQKELHLPTQEQFSQILEFMDKSKLRQASSITVKFLAYSGMRLNEAGQVTPAMIDLKRGEFRLPGEITKNGKERRPPIIEEMRPLLEALCADYVASRRSGPLLPVRDPSKCLETACAAVGAPRITNHDLRHLFVTRCLESGVDVKTVAEWVGHQDGGALILKTYAHLRNEHSRLMAAKVRFG